jgi:MYXO-CTERM domain-containing protein
LSADAGAVVDPVGPSSNPGSAPSAPSGPGGDVADATVPQAAAPSSPDAVVLHRATCTMGPTSAGGEGGVAPVAIALGLLASRRRRRA